MRKLSVLLVLILNVFVLNAQDISIFINGKQWDSKQMIKAGDIVKVMVNTSEKCMLKYSVTHRSIIAQLEADYSGKINQTVDYKSKLELNPSTEFEVDDFVNNFTSRLIIKILDVNKEDGSELSGVDYRKTYSLYDDGGPKPNNKFPYEKKGPSNVH